MHRNLSLEDFKKVMLVDLGRTHIAEDTFDVYYEDLYLSGEYHNIHNKSWSQTKSDEIRDGLEAAERLKLLQEALDV